MSMSPNIEDLITSINGTDQTNVGDDNTRIKLILAAQALAIRLETPWDFVQRVTWQEPSFIMCLKIADDISLFQHLGPADSAPKPVSALATATSVEPALLARILRHLAARHILLDDPSSPGTYRATHISEALGTREGSSGIRHTCHIYISAFASMPEFLKNNAYKVPTDNRNGVFQQQHGLQGLTLFECLQRPENKHLAEDFNLLMRFTTKGRRSFLDVCDVGALLQGRPAVDGESKYLFVDIGGGTGTDAIDFHARLSDAPGTVELQELEGVISAARAAGADAKGISLRTHDFFTPEPAKGARFYFMGSVLHDWPKPDAEKILKNIAPAMEKGYSTLLLSENVLPEAGCHPHLSAIDLTMMTTLASGERSEGDWRKLLEGAGLRIVKVHTVAESLKSVLECELL